MTTTMLEDAILKCVAAAEALDEPDLASNRRELLLAQCQAWGHAAQALAKEGPGADAAVLRDMGQRVASLYNRFAQSPVAVAEARIDTLAAQVDAFRDLLDSLGLIDKPEPEAAEVG